MPNNKITTAVILAAGLGSRLKEMGKNMPKGFLQLGKLPIIEESIQKLIKAGMQKIIIVTGHHNSFYEELKGKYPMLQTIRNEQFADSGSMYSLYLARTLIGGDFLLLESDLIYEQKALQTALAFEGENVILLSGTTNSGDEVYVSAHEGKLHEMSKNKASLTNEVVGELVGISKISSGLFQEMTRQCEKAFKQTLHVDYETDCIVASAEQHPVYYTVVDDLLWSEIDDAQHLDRAITKVYPAIIAADGKLQ